MNHLKNKLIVSLLGVFLVAGCQTTDGVEELPVQTYDNSKLYKRAEFVALNGKVYRANTAVKGVRPDVALQSSTQPLNPWRSASVQEFRAVESGAAAPVVTVPEWNSATTYYAEDVVTIGGEYFQTMWWSQNNNPQNPVNRNNYTVDGETHWGPWVKITREEAIKILENNNQNGGGSNPDQPEGGDGEDGDKDPEVTPDPVDPADLEEAKEKFKYSSSAVYTENKVAFLNGKYYRAKWWNKDHSPETPYEYAWDSPWEEISADKFLALANGTTPPVEQPENPDKPDPENPGGGIVPPPVTPDPEYAEIVKRGYIQEWAWDELATDLKDAFNEKSLSGSDIFATPNGNKAVDIFSDAISKDAWDLLLPRRRGMPRWFSDHPPNNGLQGKVGDFYSYSAFTNALSILGEYAYLSKVALEGTDPNGRQTSFQRNYVLHKPTRTVRLVSQSDCYFLPESNNAWLLNRAHAYNMVDYAAFGFEGTDNDKARVIAGFLAHASHETSGSWGTAPGTPFDASKFPKAKFVGGTPTELPGVLAWSLFFHEEQNAGIPYRQEENKLFPPSPGQSYHGRGAFQLSWNYNYGLASAIFFGTSKVLLDDPAMLLDGGTVSKATYPTTWWEQGRTIEGGTMAFLTSLMFWLTPQYPKPSQQDSMILNRNDGRFIDGTAKLRADEMQRGVPGYGWTINIMNGGFEAGKSWQDGHPKYDPKVERRVKHYTFFTQAMGGNNDGEVLDTVDVRQY